jgi:hypothetical protein
VHLKLGQRFPVLVALVYVPLCARRYFTAPLEGAVQPGTDQKT